MSVHASQMMIPVAEITLDYGSRPNGSSSKLRTIPDGLRILATFLMLAKETRPLAVYGCIGAAFAVLSFVLMVPVIATYLQTGLVPRLPTAVVASGAMVIAILMFACGLILDSVTRSRVEQKRILFLNLAPLNTQ